MTVAARPRLWRQWDLWLGWATSALVSWAGVAAARDAFGGPSRQLLTIYSLVLALFSALVLIARAAPQRVFRALRVGTLCLLAAILGISGRVLFSTPSGQAMRRQVEREIGMAELQRTAVGTLQAQRMSHRKFSDLPGGDKRLPVALRKMNAEMIWVNTKVGTPEQDHLTIIWGGGFGHWRIEVGGPAYQTQTGAQRWQPGIYWFNDFRQDEG